MKNVLIMGCARSGTSLAGGLLSEAGYYMGEELMDPSEANPKGFFEWPYLNRLNEQILEPVTPTRLRFFGRFLDQTRPRRGGAQDRWTSRIPLTTTIPSPSLDLLEKMKAVLSKAPYCYKDPRFCYTIPRWQPLLKDTLLVVTFRHPILSARSMAKLASTEGGLLFEEKQALENVKLTYAHVLRAAKQGGDWLFVHYEQMLNGDCFDRLEAATGATINRDFPKKDLKRTKGEEEQVPPELVETYRELCRLAGYAGG
jgi:hypothetical protein